MRHLYARGGPRAAGHESREQQFGIVLVFQRILSMPKESKQERLAKRKASLALGLHADQCRFYLIRKSRYCTFTAEPGKQMCFNHGGLDMSKRVKCPYDDKQCA